MQVVAVGVLGLALLFVGSGAAGAEAPSGGFPLYWAGERVDDLPLTAVLRRDDTARYVSFVYGDCEASDDAGCAPPAEIQVWPSCLRNLGLYDDPGPVAPGERLSVRGVPAAFFDDGTRLELETGGSTIVVFAGTRGRALGIAAALRSLDDLVLPGHPLPARREGGGAMDC